MSTLGSGIALRSIGAIFNVLAIPISLNALGQEQFAASAALLGLAGWVMIGSAGLGSATALSVSATARDSSIDRDAFWQSIVAGLINTGALAAAGILCINFFLPSLFHGDNDEFNYQIRLGAYYCLFAFSLSSVGSIFEGLFAGLLKTAFCNKVRFVCQTIALALLYVITPKYPTILGIVMVMTAAPTLASVFFIVRGSVQCPPPSSFRYHMRKGTKLLKQGIGFYAYSMAILFYGGGGLPLFALAFGPDQLATASVMARITQIYIGVLAIIVVPLSTFLRSALYKSEFDWMKRLLTWIGIALFGLGVSTIAVLQFFGDQLIDRWTHTKLPHQHEWLLPLCILLLVLTWTIPWAYITFATRGSKTAATTALIEIGCISVLYVILHPYVSASSSLLIVAIVAFLFSGTFLPWVALRDLRQRMGLVPKLAPLAEEH